MRQQRRGAPKRSMYKKKASVRGRKPVYRRRQPVRQQSKGGPKRQTMQASLGGLTLTRFVSARKPNAVASHIKKVGQPNFINITYPGVISGAGGTQAYSAWYLNAGNDLRRIWASIQGASTFTNNTTKAEYPAAADASGTPLNASFRYVLETAQSLLHFANTSGTPINVELYDIAASRDSPQLPLDFLGGAVVDQSGSSIGRFTGAQNNMLSPDLAWFYGMKNEGSSASGFVNAYSTAADISPNNLGATPYQSKLFKDYFKVVRKTNISLPIGGQHKHHVDLKPNAVIDNDMMSQNSVYKGLSFFTLVVASGVPVVKCPDANADHVFANPLGDATTSQVSISVIQQVKYKWTWVEDSRENIYRANYINQANPYGAQSVQPAMNIVVNADSKAQVAEYDSVSGAGVATLLPNVCTRLDAKGVDCGCE